MDTRGGALEIAHVHHGGAAAEDLAAALVARGHRVRPVRAVGDLEPRDPATGAWRLSAGLVAHLAASALRFGARALDHRWNTLYAFDRHSERARRALAALDPPPRVILQHGALFAPGIPPRAPYVLLCDDTSAAAARAAGPPRPDLGPAWRAREAAVYAGARAICTTSAQAAASLVDDYRIPAGRVHVVGGGGAIFPAAPARVDDGRTVLLVARDLERGGGALAVEALRRVRRSQRKARLLIAAPGRAGALPQGSAAIGPLGRGELEDVLALSTALVAPVRGATTSGAVLEAMACGVPCVVARGGALTEVVEDGVTGLHVAPGDAGALAAALAALLADPARARAMGAAARRAVEAWWRWPLVAERVERALRDAAPRPAQVAA
jgi:glycosyltransferase involved in cell wall biosynthesis